MPLEYYTLAVQFLILGIVGWTGWSIYRTTRSQAQTLSMVREYRREISWLTSRIEALEGQAKIHGQGVRP